MCVEESPLVGLFVGVPVMPNVEVGLAVNVWVGVPLMVEVRVAVGMAVGLERGPKVYVFWQAKGERDAIRIPTIRRCLFILASIIETH